MTGRVHAIGSAGGVLVTSNAVEFRSRYRRIDVHPRVVFLPPTGRRPAQIELFSAALDAVEADPDRINTALDVDHEQCRVVVRRYVLS